MKNSGFRLQTQTNVLLQIYGLSTLKNATSNLAVMTKEPLGAGRYEIVARMNCGSILGLCHFDRH